jgi:hypothetical protein
MSHGILTGASWAGLVAIGALGAIAARPFIDGPPPGTTGGFGEPTCAQCHYDVGQPDPNGALQVEGFPDSWVPDEQYDITVRLHRPGMGRGGFQLAIRFANGEQAGTLTPTDDRTATELFTGITYAYQTVLGAEQPTQHRNTWQIEWRAPRTPTQTVILHAVGNAANNDDSQFGDHIYTYSASSEPAQWANGPLLTGYFKRRIQGYPAPRAPSGRFERPSPSEAFARTARE